MAKDDSKELERMVSTLERIYQAVKALPLYKAAAVGSILGGALTQDGEPKREPKKEAEELGDGDILAAFSKASTTMFAEVSANITLMAEAAIAKIEAAGPGPKEEKGVPEEEPDMSIVDAVAANVEVALMSIKEAKEAKEKAYEDSINKMEDEDEPEVALITAGLTPDIMSAMAEPPVDPWTEKKGRRKEEDEVKQILQSEDDLDYFENMAQQKEKEEEPPLAGSFAIPPPIAAALVMDEPEEMPKTDSVITEITEDNVLGVLQQILLAIQGLDGGGKDGDGEDGGKDGGFLAGMGAGGLASKAKKMSKSPTARAIAAVAAAVMAPIMMMDKNRGGGIRSLEAVRAEAQAAANAPKGLIGAPLEVVAGLGPQVASQVASEVGAVGGAYQRAIIKPFMDGAGMWNFSNRVI